MKASPALFLMVFIAITSALADDEDILFNPVGSFTVEVSLENSPWLRLPLYRNAITSLEVVGDHALGGTTAKPGLDPYLFTVSIPRRALDEVLDLGTLVPGQRGVQSGFAKGGDGWLYAGTLPDRAESGHLLKVRKTARGLEAVDLGTPLPGEGIFALASDPQRGALYGLSHPSGRFFIVNLANGRVRIFDETRPTQNDLYVLVDHFRLQPADYLCRRLIVDHQGRVYGSKPINKLFRFLPDTGRIEVLRDDIPQIRGRRALGRVDSWALGPDKVLYGGNAVDGQVFRLDPETGEVTNLGSPVATPRVKAMAFAADGRLYGLSGASPEYAHLFTYDPRTRGFTDLGQAYFLMVGQEMAPETYWRGFQLGTLAVSEDGRWVVMGEEEALSQLMLFPITP